MDYKYTLHFESDFVIIIKTKEKPEEIKMKIVKKQITGLTKEGHINTIINWGKVNYVEVEV